MVAARRVLGFCVLTLACTAPSARAIVLHATDASNQGLYAIDTAMFEVQLVGSYAIPVEEVAIGGLAFDANGVLYGISLGTGAALYTLDAANATTVRVGSLNADLVFEGGLAFEPGTGVLFAVNQESALDSHLMTIDKTTGEATIVGRIAGEHHDFAGLAFDASGQLYAIDRIGDALWKIDKANPASASTIQVGSGLGSGIHMGDTGGMTGDPATSTFYGYSGNSHHLFTVDLATGTGSVLHQFQPGEPVFWSLAYRDEKHSATIPKSWGLLKDLYRR